MNQCLIFDEYFYMCAVLYGFRKCRTKYDAFHMNCLHLVLQYSLFYCYWMCCCRWWLCGNLYFGIDDINQLLSEHVLNFTTLQQMLIQKWNKLIEYRFKRCQKCSVFLLANFHPKIRCNEFTNYWKMVVFTIFEHKIRAKTKFMHICNCGETSLTNKNLLHD